MTKQIKRGRAHNRGLCSVVSQSHQACHGTGLAVPNVVVPDEVTWTVQLLNRTNPEAVAGSRYVYPPTIGSSMDNVWDHAGGVWTAHVSGIMPSGFGAIITAVPEVPCDPCDANCDGLLDVFDIEPFLDLLFGPNPAPCDTCTGDANGDGNVDAFDIEPFLNCLFP